MKEGKTIFIEVVTALTVSAITWLLANFFGWSGDIVAIILCGLNIIILAIFLIATEDRVVLKFEPQFDADHLKFIPNPEFKPNLLGGDKIADEDQWKGYSLKERAKLAYWYKIENEVLSNAEKIEKADWLEERANLLVDQLIYNVRYFAYTCIFAYISLIVEHLVGIVPEFKKYTKEIIITSHIFTDLLSFVAVCFIGRAFIVFYDDTLTAENKPKPYGSGLNVIAIVFIVFYSFWLAVGYNENSFFPTDNTLISIKYKGNAYQLNIEDTSVVKQDSGKMYYQLNGSVINDSLMLINRKPNPSFYGSYTRNSQQLRLIVGFWNALLMSLLFANYFFAERLVNKLHPPKFNRKFIEVALYFLMVYAAAQLFYGNFDISAYGDKVIFGNIVFSIYLIGKIIFLYLTWFLRRSKILHLYMHISLSREGIGKKIKDCFQFN